MNPVFFPYTSIICDADDLRREFAAHDRAYYPDELYQNLFDFLCEAYADEEFTTLDVIELCCDMRGLTPTDLPDDVREELANEYRHDVEAHSDAIMEALREYASEEGYYLATDEERRIVWII